MRSLLHAILALFLAMPMLAEAGLFGSDSKPKDASSLSLEERVNLLERRMDTLSNIVLQLETMQQELQKVRGEVEEQKHEMTALKKRQRDLYMDIDQRIARLSGEPVPEPPPPIQPPSKQPPASDVTTNPAATITPPPASSGGQAAVPAGSGQDGQEYQTALNLLMQDRKMEARKAFTEFLSRHPQSDLVGNAQYWLAETYYVAKEYDAAMQEFNKVIQQYPNSSKVPDSMLKSGFIQYERQQWDLARKQLEDLVSRYPGSDASQLAQKRLDRMFREGH
jgi:tol-pal system protein YbgF